MRRMMVGLLVGASVVGVAAGCSNTVTQEEFTKELTDQGIDAGLASCITDELAGVGFEFRKYGDLSAAEETQITEATTTCISKDLDVELDAGS